MAELKNAIVYFRQASDGRWLAATGTAPYFCFEAESQDAVLQVATRALRFYADAIEEFADELKTHKGRGETIPTFDRRNAISAKDLVAA